MDPNGKLLNKKMEVPRSRVEREEWGRASKQIGLGWSDQKKDNNMRAE